MEVGVLAGLLVCVDDDPLFSCLPDNPPFDEYSAILSWNLCAMRFSFTSSMYLDLLGQFYRHDKPYDLCDPGRDTSYTTG